jgi:hypothetical protein
MNRILYRCCICNTRLTRAGKFCSSSRCQSYKSYYHRKRKEVGPDRAMEIVLQLKEAM